MSDESHDAAAALELFTDPMCNIFGTFCFIVILLGFLSVAQKPVEAPAAPAAAAPDAERQAQDAELARLQAEVDAAVSPQRRERLEQVEALKLAVRRRSEVQVEASRREDAAVRELMQTTDAASSLKGMLPQLQRDIERMKQAIADAESRSTVQLSLPNEHVVPGAGSGAMILTGGRAYMVMKMPEAVDRPPCEALGSFDPDGVDVQATTLDCGDGGAEQHVKLKQGGGVDLRSEGWRDSAVWKRWAQGIKEALRRQRVVMNVDVAADSHAEFGPLRAALLSLGVDYNVRMADPPWDLRWSWGNPHAQ